MSAGLLVAEAFEEVLEEAAASPPPAASFLVVLVALRAAASFDFAEEVLIGVARCPLALLHQDAVELSSVEPHAAAFGARVDQDLAALRLNETGAVDWAPQRLAA
jgi:hypothetical protein